MIVCPKCKKEMKVTKMGVAVRYGIDCAHSYMGDLYVCPECSHEIVSCNSAPCHNTNFKKDDVYMEGTYAECVKTFVNLRGLEDGSVLQQSRSDEESKKAKEGYINVIRSGEERFQASPSLTVDDRDGRLHFYTPGDREILDQIKTVFGVSTDTGDTTTYRNSNTSNGDDTSTTGAN